MSEYRIPFNRASTQGRELEYLAQALRSGYLAGAGSFSKRCQEWLQNQLGVPRALLTTSCTHALEMAALLLELKPGDEVIVPSFTFPSTVNAFALRGATPVFCDIRPDTLNIDERLVESLITERTRAMFVVHYAGIGCEMEVLSALATRHGIMIVEDAAHALFGRYRGRPLGTFGCLATLSFHETKNVSCGEGGALLINDAAFIERAEVIREKGTDRSRMFRGLVDKYTWVDYGSSYLPSDLLAAVLLAQLECSEQIQQKRRLIWENYFRELSPWAAEHQVRLPTIPESSEQAYHLFYLLMPTAAVRDALLAHLRARGILAVFHYLPLHRSAMGRKLGRTNTPLAVTDRVSETIVRLPFYTDLSTAEQAEVIEALLSFSCDAPVTAGGNFEQQP